MKRKIFAGTTSVSLPVIVYDNTSTTGAGLSGITHASSGLVFEYRRAGASSWTSVTPVSKTLGTYTSGGIVASGSRAGRYEIDIPDAAVAAGVRFVEICLRGVASMHPVDIEIELDAVNYQDATRFGLGAIPNVVQGNSGALPTGDASGRVTVIANQDKTGYSLTQSFPANFANLSIDGSGRVTVGSNADKTGYSLTQIFPANFAALGIDPTGILERVGLVDELGPDALNANSLQDDIAIATFSALTTYAWPNNSFGKHLLISDNNNRSVKVVGAGAGHVAADVHAIQLGVIVAGSFAANAIDANALASDAATEIATSVGNLQVLTRLDSMIESNGAGQFRFDSIAVSLAGGGGGGGDPWTIDLVTGYSGTQAGAILNSVKSKTDLITSGNVETSLPVTAVGQIASPLVIGDDYLNSNGRAFSWTVALPTGYVVGTSTCKFGMRYEDSQGINSFIVTGTVVDAGAGNATLRFDVPRLTSQDLRPGWYDWSVEISNATSEITPVKSGRNAEWQFKQT